MFWLIGMAIFGLLVGLVAKAIHPGDDPVGFLPTMGIGVAGTYIGGLINFILGWGSFGATSGILLSLLGAVLFLAAWRWWKLKQNNRQFWSGNLK
jgi:uncharacterized membrane protein YeaQ/YmgE (transglycosylase-associated protein family)